MIRFILVICMYLLSLVGFSQNKPQANNVTVTVTNAVSDKGKVYFALYDSQESFNNKSAVLTAEGSLLEGVAKVIFNDVKPGTYAIVCYHDANGNGKLDFSDNGMPLEDYGASNNTSNFGPPNFNDAKFDVSNGDLNLIIKF